MSDDGAAATSDDGATEATGGATTGSTDGVPRWAVVALGTGLLGMGLTVGGYGAIVPLLVAGGVPADVAGAGTSLFLLGQVLAVWPAERLSRRRPPRSVAAAGFLVGAVGAALLAVPTLSATVASRLLVGLGQGAAFVAAMKHVGGRTTGADTATAQGLLGAGFTTGFALGLAATPAALDVGGPPLPAAASALVLALGGVGAVTLSPTAREALPPLGRYVAAFRAPAAAALTLGNAATFGFLMVAGTWYTDLLASTTVPVVVGLLGFAFATVAGRAVGGVVAARIGDRATVGWSLVAQTGLLALAAWGLATGRPTVLLAGVVLSGLGFGVPFGPLFALAFTELSPDAGVTLVGMLAVGNLAALAYPWLVGRLLVDTGSFAAGLAAMAATVAGVAVVWAATVGLDVEARSVPGASPDD